MEYLKRHHQQYDALIFFTYLYAPTVLGLSVAPAKSILVPTAHDEPAIHLDIYKEMFGCRPAVAYNTEVERRFLTTHFSDPRGGRGNGRMRRGSAARASVRGRVRRGREPARRARYRCRRTTTAAASAHRRPRRDVPAAAPAARPFALYGGRIDPGKGCEELIEYFSGYVAEGGDASLVLMGVKLMQLPEEPWIRFAGLLSERERLQALEAATVVVVPSPYESLSLLALEAFAVGTPILANARSEVLVDHCLRSNAGLFYADRDEFVEALKLLLMRWTAARRRWDRTAGSTSGENYRWDVIMSKYDRMIGEDSQDGEFGRHDCEPARASSYVSSLETVLPARAYRLTFDAYRPLRARRAVGPLAGGACRFRPSRLAWRPPAARPDVVPLDHLVQRRRLDVQQLGRALLHAAGRLERRLDQPLLEVGDDFLERDAFGRHR